MFSLITQVVVVEYFIAISKHMKRQSEHKTKYNNGNWGTSVAKAVFPLALGMYHLADWTNKNMGRHIREHQSPGYGMKERWTVSISVTSHCKMDWYI